MDADLARTRDLLDLHEGRGVVAVLDDAGIADLLRASRTIAVVGASANPARPSHRVMQSLIEAGYRCLPVNPSATEVAGLPAYPNLAAAAQAAGPIDLVDVFRRPEHCPAHAREAVAIGATALWLQIGIVSWDAAAIAQAGGLAVVMDRCTEVEVRRLAR